jgi:hypothetical protein
MQSDDDNISLSSEYSLSEHGDTLDSSSSSSSSEEEDEPDYLSWPEIVQLCCTKYSDEFGEDTIETVSSKRMLDESGFPDNKDTERTRLPLYGTLKKALTHMPKDIKNPPLAPTAKKDSQPLGRGIYPEPQHGLEVSPVSEMFFF